MTRTLRTIDALMEAGLVARKDVPQLEEVARRYAVAISPTVMGLFDHRDRGDPIARQFVPSTAELRQTARERLDPIGDQAHTPVPGIVHRHPDRALFKPVHICPVYCRFCFRREMIGSDGDGMLSDHELEAALAYVAQHKEIWEVIVTGGDPFVLGPRRIGQLAQSIAAIPHVAVIRWHTRVPVVDPGRIDGEFIAALKVDGATTFVALHANHPREFSEDARAAVARLIASGIPLVSQSVLLRGVNDDIETLVDLMRGFVEMGVKPYYLHHADLAPGTSHFRVPIEEGKKLMDALRKRVSGLCVPSYVVDIPGGHAKVPLSMGNAEKTSDGYRLRDHAGHWHDYSDSD